MIYIGLGKCTEAEQVILCALTLRERRSGTDHPGTAYVLGQLAGLYIAQGKYPAEEPLARRALCNLTVVLSS